MIYNWRPATGNDVTHIVKMAQDHFQQEIDLIYTPDPVAYSRNITLAVVNQFYLPTTELLSVATSDSGELLAYTWARANETVEQLCDTVWRPHQFSWTGNKVYVTDDAAYAEAVRLAWAVVKGKVANPVPGATHFHATHVKPYWIKHSQKIQRIGNHVFYKPKERKNGSSKA